MKRVNPPTVVIVVTILAALVLCAGCIDMSECGDIWNLSPTEMFAENDYVMLGRYLETDTILDLGRREWEGSESHYYVIEYQFSIDTVIQGAETLSTALLWKVEQTWIHEGLSTIMRPDTSRQQLIYGCVLKDQEDRLGIIGAPDIIIELRGILKDSSAYFGYADPAELLMLAEKILGSTDLEASLLARSQETKVLFGSDNYLQTLESFEYGYLCYYDTTGQARSVTSEQYLASLLSTAKRFGASP